MMVPRFLVLFAFCLMSSRVTVAQSSLNSPEKIDIPKGHALVEMPAIFETTSEPVLQNADAQSVLIPPGYKYIMKNGVRARHEVTPERRADRLIRKPYETRKTRRVKLPIRYILTNEEGEIVQRWLWKNGQLIQTE